MSGGWVAVPHAAVAAVRGPLGRGAVLDLYERAHLTGYAPMRITDRALAVDWGMSRHEVWITLDALVDAGCIEVEKGSLGVATRIRVLPAVGDRGSSDGGGSGQCSGQDPAKTNERQTPIIEASRPGVRPGSPARVITTRARVEEKKPDQDLDDEETRARDLLIEEQVAALAALQGSQEGSPPDETDRAALRRRLLGGLTSDELAALWAWSGISDDRLVEGCRDGGWRRWRSLLGGRFADARLKAARAWDAAGRPAATAAPSSSRRSAPAPKFSIAEMRSRYPRPNVLPEVAP